MVEVEGISLPSLERCILVDSRFSSRQMTAQELRSTRLFLEVIEARSLSEGLHILKSSDIDACVVGETVSSKGAAEFVHVGASLNEKCAFIVLRKQRSPDDEDFNCPEAHSFLSRPYNETKFARAMVTGVVRANVASPWVAVVMEKGGEAWEELKRELNSIFEHSLLEDSSDVSQDFSDMFVETSGFLDELAVGVEQGIYYLDARGSPNPAARLAVSDVVRRISLGRESLRVDDFTDELRRSLYEWLGICTEHGRLEADQRLRLSLLSFIEQLN